jgi:hypothetical protein
MTRFIKTRTDKENKPPINAKKASKQLCSYHKCKKEAVGRYTVDLDIKGLHYCKQHKADIQAAVLWSILGIEELAKNSMGVKIRKSAKKL